MKTIREHMKTNQYKPVYLLYGSESYLKQYYMKKLREAIIGDGESMNVSMFSGKEIDWKEIQTLADTMPFFAERRVIVLENTGTLKSAGDFADYVPNIPDTTVVIFVEEEVDKRNRLFKAIHKYGYVCELNGLSEKDLKLWTAQLLQKEGKKITEENLNFFLERVGTDMQNIQTEREKLVCYAYDREVITKEDITAVTTEQITGKIFQMIDALAMKNQAKALQYYYDLLTLREKPLTILYLMIRQFNLLLQVKAFTSTNQEYNKSALASKLGVPPFAVTKYVSQAKQFSQEIIVEAITYGTELEQQVKTGKLIDQIAVELFLVKYSE